MNYPFKAPITLYEKESDLDSIGCYPYSKIVMFHDNYNIMFSLFYNGGPARSRTISLYWFVFVLKQYGLLTPEQLNQTYILNHILNAPKLLLRELDNQSSYLSFLTKPYKKQMI